MVLSLYVGGTVEVEGLGLAYVGVSAFDSVR
jgi:hypothetical protein